MVKEIDQFQPEDYSEVLTALRAVDDYTGDHRLVEVLRNLADIAAFSTTVPSYSFEPEQSQLVFASLRARADQAVDTWDRASARWMLGEIIMHMPSLAEATSHVPSQDDYPTGEFVISMSELLAREDAADAHAL